jgi:CubicO group peptidase (beta-lactamase class C family)
MEVAAERAGFDGARLERITGHLGRNYVEPGKFAGCQVLVSRRGVPAYFRSLGSMDLERGKPMRDDTIFRIYSMTKPITSVALMQLYEQGYFQLNDPVSRVVPPWKGHRVWVSGDKEEMVTKEPSSPMTFRHVLSHTGGLTYGASNHPVDKVYRREQIMGREGEGDAHHRHGQAFAGAVDVRAWHTLAVFPIDRRLRCARRIISGSGSTSTCRSTSSSRSGW